MGVQLWSYILVFTGYEQSGIVKVIDVMFFFCVKHIIEVYRKKLSIFTTIYKEVNHIGNVKVNQKGETFAWFNWLAAPSIGTGKKSSETKWCWGSS